MKNTISAFIVVSALSMSAVASAQTKVTPAKVDRIQMESLWLSSTNNAAGGIIDAPQRVAEASAAYDITKGDFKPSQLGNDNKDVTFYTQGGGIYDKLGGWYIWGSFKYTNDNIAGARWNATLVDPLRDMPFFLADSTYSKWKNQKYDLAFKVATPVLFNHLVLGFTGKYNVAQAAKQVDPRPLTDMSNLEVMPSILWKFNEHHSLGADFHYISYREDGTASNVNHLHEPMAWEIVAPGYFNNGAMGSVGGSIKALRNYNANALGGGVQYSYTGEKWKAVAYGDYLYRVEDVTCSYTKPQMVGTVKNTKYDAGISAQINLGSNILFASYKYASKSIDGIEYFQTYDNTYEVQSWITDALFIRSNFKTVANTAKVDFMITGDADDYSWKMGAQVDHTSDSYIYYLPKTTRDVQTLEHTEYVTKNFHISDAHSVLLTVNGGYSHNLGADFNYGGVKGEDIGYTEFALLDYKYSALSYAKFGADVTYVYGNVGKGKSSLFINGSYKRYCPKSNELFNSRSFATIKVGLTF